MSTITKDECFVAPEVNLGPVSPGEYLTKVAQWLKEIADKLNPCPQVNQIKRIGHSIESFKLWISPDSEEKDNSNDRVLRAFENHFNERVRRHGPMVQLFSSPAEMRQVLGKRVLEFEKSQFTYSIPEIDQLYLDEERNRNHEERNRNHVQRNGNSEPNWKPLAFDINNPEIYEQQEANMKAYLKKNKGIRDYEMDSWVMLAMGIIVDSKNSDYLAMTLQILAFARGGRTLVQLLEFEMKTRASEAVYEETAYEWNCEQVGE